MRIPNARIVLMGLLLAGACERGRKTELGAGALTPDQQVAVQRIYEQDGQQLLRLREQLASKRYELGALTASERPDETKIASITKEVSDLTARALDAEAVMQRRLAEAGCPMNGVGGGWSAMGPGMGARWMEPGSMMGAWNRLSADQQTKVQQIYVTEGQKVLGLGRRLASKQYELNTLVSSESPDETKIQTATREIAAINEQLVRAQVAMRRRLSEAGVPAWGFGMCPMCGDMMGPGMGMTGPDTGMMGRGMMGPGMGMMQGPAMGRGMMGMCAGW